MGSTILSVGTDRTSQFVMLPLPLLVIAHNALVLGVGDRVLATSDINVCTAPLELTAIGISPQQNLCGGGDGRAWQ
jgi:hypothetical protein